MELGLASEHVERACHQPDCSVGMAARTAVTDLLEPALEPREVDVLRTGEPFETAGDRIEPVHARTTLPGALAREAARQARRLDDPADACRQHKQRARTEGRTERHELRVEQRCPLGVGRSDPAAEITADQVCTGRLGLPARQLDELTDRDTEADLVHAGPRDRARERYAHGTRLPAVAELAKPF